MNAKELRQHIAKIKKLLKLRDHQTIMQGVELARGLNEPAVFEHFLEGCSIGKADCLSPFYRGASMYDDFEGQPLRNKMFFGTKPAQPFLDYALLGLIAGAPEDAALHPSLKISNITTLVTNAAGWTRLPPGLANFTELTTLNLRNCRQLVNLDVLAHCPKLTTVIVRHCNALQIVGGLVHCAELSNLCLKPDAAYLQQNPPGHWQHWPLNPKPAKTHMTSREEVAAYQKRIEEVG